MMITKTIIEKVQKGLTDVANEKINSKAQAKQKLSKWLEVSGPIVIADYLVLSIDELKGRGKG
ncbi:MAG: hypothetical protein V4594_14675 [Bacteroidota bacterium]